MLHQLEERLAVAFDREEVREGERDALTGVVRVVGCDPVRDLGAGGVPEVALEIGDERRPDQLRRPPRAPRAPSDAPRYVLSVRSASGVTTIRQRPDGMPSVAGGVSNCTPAARRSWR